MLSRLIRSIERTPLTLTGFIATFSAIVFIRCALEALSSPTSSGFPSIDPQTLVHYGSFYLAAYFAFALVIGFFTKNYEQSAKMLLFAFPIIWVPPLIDLFFHGALGSTMTYLFHAPPLLFRDFFTFFGPFEKAGITLGIRLEIAAALIGVALYVWRTTRSVARTILAAISFYAVSFLLVALPSLIFLVSGGIGLSSLPFFVEAIQSSGLVANALPGTAVPSSDVVFLETGFNKLMSLVFVPVITALGVLLAYTVRPTHVLAHLKNSRATRFFSYTFFIISGILFALPYGFTASWPDVLGIVSLLIALYGAWMVAVCTNDLVDTDIDALSNKNRPLIKGTLSHEDMRGAAWLFFALLLFAAWSAGYYPLFFILLFTALYFIYSVPPLRLKRIPVLSSLLIGGAGAAVTLAGFTFASPDKTVEAYPLTFVLGVFICFALVANIRDLKDIEGDEAAGIPTLATLLKKWFGRENAFRIIGALAALAFFISPLFVSVPLLPFAAVIAGVLSYAAIVSKPYNERFIALVAFVYLFAAGLLYLCVQ
ncbi:UbiA family prenyltransferase [Candidatus Parcubacteria bacterium]|nr:UbiA family prenyltransferase [Candidatus Parcubacteria bacterium]